MSMDLEEQYDKIYRYCWRKLHDVQAAEDAVQETFARYLAAENYREQGKALRYLYVTARNLCADARRAPESEPLPEDLPAPEGPDTERLLDLRRALATLPEDEQELLLLRYVNQEPVGVIASLLGVSRFVVYRRTAAALEKLRRSMEES